MEIIPDGLEGVLDGVIIRARPRGETGAFFEIQNDSAVHDLVERAQKTGKEYEIAVMNYLKIFATYKQMGKPRPLVEDARLIYAGMQITETLSKADKFAIMMRDSVYTGSWDDMLASLKQKVDTEPLFKHANGNNGKQDFEIIEKLKQYEAENKINLADYFIAL